MEDNISKLAAELNGHQITDDQGDIREEETSQEDTAAPETNTEDEPTNQSEKTAEPEKDAPKADDQDSETNPVEDESGKRYVPESRFNEVYGQAKSLEREREALRLENEALKRAGLPNLAQTDKPTAKSNSKERVAEKADVLELKMTLPQFDPKYDDGGKPTNPDYSEELDKLGYALWKANPQISLVEAGRQAMGIARRISKKEAEITTEARKIKAIQSDQGITNHAGQNRGGGTTVDIDGMSDKELERYMRENKLW